MSDYFLIANLEKMQFVEVNKFTAGGYEADQAQRPVGVSSRQIATVVLYMKATSDSFPSMGAWAEDRVIVSRDGDRRAKIDYEEIRESWEDITEETTAGFFNTVEESSEPFCLPLSAVRCPSCGESTAYSHYGGNVNATVIKCGMCGGWDKIEAAGAQWSAQVIV